MKRYGTAVFAGLATVLLWGTSASAQLPPTPNLDSYGLRIFQVESGLYPFVQVYFRTFDQNMRPLINLNERNIGLMVKGRSYDPAKRQYMIQDIRTRDEAVRAIFVIDCSKTMQDEPFEAALDAAARYVEGKRPQDQVAIIAVRDADAGYEVVSSFERDPATLVRRMADLRADGNTTRLYDGIGAAMQMSALVSQGGIRSTDAEYIISTSIIVFSDGKDEGSALSRSELMNRITALSNPVPIYSLAYTRVEPEHLLNLQALSKNSFGIYFPIDESVGYMTRVVEEIQNIQQSDYVLTFRAYQPVDGQAHPLKVGVEYPSNSGKIVYQGADFEAVNPPPIEEIIAMQRELDDMLNALPDGDPYLPASPFAPGIAPNAAPAAEN